METLKIEIEFDNKKQAKSFKNAFEKMFCNTLKEKDYTITRKAT